jgi:hypothetical protein
MISEHMRPRLWFQNRYGLSPSDVKDFSTGTMEIYAPALTGSSDFSIRVLSGLFAATHLLLKEVGQKRDQEQGAKATKDQSPLH